MSEEKIDIKITRSPDFKLIYAGGAFGGLYPMEAHIIFYIDRMVPKIVEGLSGQMKTDYVERELQAEIHMSPQEFISVYKWMGSHIERLEKEGILTRKAASKV